MDAEGVRAFLLKLPHVVETMQWGNNLVFWVGDKAIGGKMFALVNIEGDGKGVISFAAGAERFAELVEGEGVSPAPYFARIFWIAVERWDVLRAKEWERELRGAYELTLDKLPAQTRQVLTLPAKELQQRIAERRGVLSAAAAKKVPGSHRTAPGTKAGKRKAAPAPKA